MKIKEFMSKVINKAEDFLFVNYSCCFCGTETPDGNVCTNCEKLKIKPNYCQKCHEHIGDSSVICIECKDVNRIFDKSFSVYNYNSEKVAGAIQKFKFDSAKYLATNFAKILYQKFVDLNLEVDVVTSVPSSNKNVKKRGYNQAAEMAKEFCKLAGLSYHETLIKTKDTHDQKYLNKKQRLQNLIGSFGCTNKELVKNKNILVIDDVFTTGSTITACADALKKAKAKKVYGLTLAKTPLNC